MVDFGQEAFSAVISFQSLHHFAHQQKRGLYRRVHDCLRPVGVYLECDYMVTDQAALFRGGVLTSGAGAPRGAHITIMIENQKRAAGSRAFRSGTDISGRKHYYADCKK